MPSRRELGRTLQGVTEISLSSPSLSHLCLYLFSSSSSPFPPSFSFSITYLPIYLST